MAIYDIVVPKDNMLRQIGDTAYSEKDNIQYVNQNQLNIC